MNRRAGGPFAPSPPMARSNGQLRQPESPRRFAWSLTTSGTIHGTLFGLASILGGVLVTVDAASDSSPASASPVRSVRVARAEPEEPVEVVREVTTSDPWLDDPALIETPFGEALVEAPREPLPGEPLAQARLVTEELLFEVDLVECEEPDPSVVESIEPDSSAEVVTPTESKPAEQEIALEAETLVAEAGVLEAPAPRYPRISVRRGEEGTVTCRLFVSAQGYVTRVEVLESSGHDRLDEAALEALRTWRFVPRQEDGRAVATTLRHPVTFVLDRS